VKILQFFNKESQAPKTRILLFAIISGLANSLILAVINSAAEVVSGNHADAQVQYFFIYLITIILFIYTRKYSLSHATIAIEELVNKVRIRITDKIRHSELTFIENTGSSDLYTYLTKDTVVISESAVIIVSVAQSAIVLFFCFLYIAWISLLGFFIALASVGIAVLIYLAHANNVRVDLHDTVKKEAEFFGSLDHVLGGFKEIKMNQQKSDDLFQYVRSICDEATRLKIKTGLKFVIDMMFSRTFSNILLGVVVFILPILNPSNTAIVIKITATILFIMGPIEMMVGAIPIFDRATVAVENIEQLEAKLNQINKEFYPVIPDKVAEFKQFSMLHCHNITFNYLDKENITSFHAGPLNFTVKKGEVLFIVGGNGSGKSTLLKLLTGLYHPFTGSIYVDDEEIDKYYYPSYRELFAIIFTDFHLFDRLYGLKDVDEKQLRSLLKLMELDKKTKYIDGHFTNLNLSTGQKKRLAFIAAVLEDKQIYIFDEWAADQDPIFRKYFYEDMLQEMKSKGKTVIAVSHDDRYFHVADRVLKMEYGQLIEL